MTQIQILHLEVGYDSQIPDTFHPCDPPMKKVLKGHIGDSNLKAWATAKLHSLPATQTDDTWVAAYIQQKFDAALGAGKVVIDEACLWAIDPNQVPCSRATGKRGTKGPEHSGSPGTRCVLRGGEWINIRTYVLTDPNGDLWPPNRKPAYATVFASLTWKCEQGKNKKRGARKAQAKTSAKRIRTR